MLKGDKKYILVQYVNATSLTLVGNERNGDMAIDPFNKFLFWFQSSSWTCKKTWNFGVAPQILNLINLGNTSGNK